MTVATRPFLDTLFGDKPDGMYVLIWDLQDKRSQWFTDLDMASVNAADRSASGKDVYVGVGLAPRHYGPALRCPANEVAGIVGLWADVDVLHPVHRKTNLPPTMEAARDLVERMGAQPSLIVDSGHGLQAWWLFKEPWVFDSTEDRRSAAELAARWCGTLKAHAARQGWDVDSTFDLARVLRVAGTVNHKSTPKPVTIIHASDFRYDPVDFEPFLLDVAAPQPRTVSHTVIGANLTLSAEAQPPFDKWEILRDADPKVRATWERQRRDFQDQSGSSYDMALANFAVQAGWTDQEIANLLIAHRRKHGDDLKLRIDYYSRTIAKAREGLRQQEAVEALEDTLHVLSESDGTLEERATHRSTLLVGASELLGVHLERVVKYISDPPQYKLETNRGSIMLGGVEALIDWRSFRSKVAAACGVLIPKFKGDKWDQLAQALLNACEEESIGAEATDTGTCHAWLSGYLAERRPQDDWQEAIGNNYPFIKDGNTYVVGAGLRKWLSLNQGEKITAKQMGTILRAGRCVPEVIAVDGDNGRTTKNVWKLPQ